MLNAIGNRKELKYDIIFDTVSSTHNYNYEPQMRYCLKPTGEYVATNTTEPHFWLLHHFKKNHKQFSLLHVKNSAKDLTKLAAMLQDGTLKPAVTHEFQLRNEGQLREAFNLLMSRRAVGKIVFCCLETSVPHPESLTITTTEVNHVVPSTERDTMSTISTTNVVPSNSTSSTTRVIEVSTVPTECETSCLSNIVIQCNTVPEQEDSIVLININVTSDATVRRDTTSPNYIRYVNVADGSTADSGIADSGPPNSPVTIPVDFPKEDRISPDSQTTSSVVV